jgi:outer membrane protein TolC
MKNYLIYIVSFLLIQTSVSAQTLSLNEVLNKVENSYPSLKMYDSQIQSLDAASKGARNWAAPQVSTGFFMTPYNTSLWAGNNGDNGQKMQNGLGSFMVTAQQSFPNKKSNDANENYMKAMSSVTKQNKETALNDLYATVKTNYFDWIVIEKKLAVLSENQKLLKFMITDAETRYKNGLGKLSAYYKAKASLGKIENQRVELENQIEQKKIRLNTLMNRDKLAEFSVDTTYAVKDHSLMQFDNNLFYKNRSDIKVLDEKIQLAHLKQDIERQQMKPEFGVQYSHMFRYGNAPMLFSLMGMVKIPMPWSTKANKANIESLELQAQSLEEEKASMANEYTGKGYQMQQDILAKKKQVDLFKDNILSALKKNYQSNLLAYRQNTEELFELYDAWETLNSTQLEYLNQVQQLLTMQVELEKLLEIK